MTLGKIKNPKIINIKAIKKYIFNNVSPPSKIINSAKIKKIKNYMKKTIHKKNLYNFYI